ncbi:hypothetical protein T265_06171 [Opisthorchis viverrini]|uniref:Uncharacterized protein n=1 Tax=Opisthorchis viverrini TaxID=6198 RepID=A0A074ZLD1_OPIVI|nr:hypothetical protein T265_06171 [Opisthorchis viverrini]KER26597.1 hypothetical protein T265_06171 [Opisthorchis viverrini]
MRRRCKSKIRQQNIRKQVTILETSPGKTKSWPPATQPVEIMHTGEWNVNLDRTSEEEIRYEIAVLMCDSEALPSSKKAEIPWWPTLQSLLVLCGTKRKCLKNGPCRHMAVRHRKGATAERFFLSTVIPVFKKGTRTLCENYRGISLPLTVLDLCTNLSARACNAQLPNPPIIGERNCGSYNHCTTSTRFLQLTMMMMMMIRHH